MTRYSNYKPCEWKARRESTGFYLGSFVGKTEDEALDACVAYHQAAYDKRIRRDGIIMVKIGRATPIRTLAGTLGAVTNPASGDGDEDE